MMSSGGSLREKLRALGALPGSVDAPRLPEPERLPYRQPPPAPEPGIEAYLPGFWQDTPDGRSFVVEQRFELDYMHGAIPLGRTLDVDGEVVARIGRDAGLTSIAPERALYIDTETTGLAGGTGTYAFLVGVGHFCDGGFRLRQYFQTDFGQERGILRALADFLPQFDAVVSFNGKSFDLPLLETRFTLNGLSRRASQPQIRAFPHLDLLHPARRIYRDRFPSCRLAELEQQVLGLVRQEDVPSWEIPSLYFRYVRDRRFRAVLPVFHHNALDVLSLVTLTAHLCDFFGGEGATTSEDRLALGRACESDGMEAEAIANYRAALEIGLRPASRDDCERRLSLLYRRAGRLREAISIWEEVAARPRNQQLFPFLELAKFRERVEGDFAAAVQASKAGMALLERQQLRYGASNARDRASLLRRIERLEKRSERVASRKRPARLSEPAGEP